MLPQAVRSPMPLLFWVIGSFALPSPPPPALLEAAAGLPGDPASSGFAPYRRSVLD